MSEKPGIYIIVHRASGRAYVGGTRNVSKRWSRHRKDLRKGQHRNPSLQEAWDRHGESSFTFCVAEWTDDLVAREQWWLDYLGAYEKGFNLCPTAVSSSGRKWSAREREARGPGHGAWLNTPEQRARRGVASAARNRARRTLTVEQVRLIRRERQMGVKLSELAVQFGLSSGTLSEISNGRLYADVV